MISDRSCGCYFRFAHHHSDHKVVAFLDFKYIEVSFITASSTSTGTESRILSKLLNFSVKVGRYVDYGALFTREEKMEFRRSHDLMMQQLEKMKKWQNDYQIAESRRDKVELSVVELVNTASEPIEIVDEDATKADGWIGAGECIDDELNNYDKAEDHPSLEHALSEADLPMIQCHKDNDDKGDQLPEDLPCLVHKLQGGDCYGDDILEKISSETGILETICTQNNHERLQTILNDAWDNEV